MNAHDTSFSTVPSNVQAEGALIGAILQDSRLYEVATRIVETEHFYEPIHRLIFDQVGKMLAAGKAVSPITMKTYLPATVPGLKLDDDEGHLHEATVPQYLARLASVASAPSGVKGLAITVFDAWRARRALSVAETAVTTLLNLDPGIDVLDQMIPIEEAIDTLRAEQVRSEQRVGVGKHYIDHMTAANQRGQILGVPICLPEIADVISEPCLEAGNLYGLLSSSGEGKTALTVQIIVHALRQGHPVLFLSYDQSSDQIVRQMIAQEYGIEARRQRAPKLLSEKEWSTCLDFANWIDRQPYEVIRCTNQNAAQLVGYARTFVKRFGNGKNPLIVVDHIGVVTPDDKRADEGSKAKGINQVFKAGAETTDSAWLVLNQRNSYGMKRDNPRPISADLYGGDPAKQAYDAIFYLYRFIKFLEERKAVASTDQDWKKIAKVFPSAVRDDGEDIAEIGSIKCRFGSPHIKAQLRFEARLTKYHSLRQSDGQQSLDGMEL